MNNEAPSSPPLQSRAARRDADPLLAQLAQHWRDGGAGTVPAELPDWLLHKLRARLERGASGGDGVARALPADASPPAAVVPALDTMELEVLAALQSHGLLDRAALDAAHCVFAEARAELAGRADGDEALQKALAARDHQLSVATHELRTPISSILLNLQILERTARREGALDAETIVRLLEVPARQLRRLTRMVDLLLDSAQVENERLVLDLQPVDLCELVHDAASRLAELARTAGCELDLSDCQPVHGHWDRLRLEQVVSNLLTNAVKYGGGKVQVRTFQPGQACIVVSDNGRGIAAEDHERIFQPYERVHGSGSEEGAGLGLYIVREIVRAHGGRIELESRIGQGTTFRVFLPTTLQAAEPVANKQDGADQGGEQA